MPPSNTTEKEKKEQEKKQCTIQHVMQLQRILTKISEQMKEETDETRLQILQTQRDAILRQPTCPWTIRWIAQSQSTARVCHTQKS